ncbi:MAG: hypothetical protein K8W52_43280 [Deltaproteobacteria bacterium]|nr:hypothetical protein [Deltaproteobacteria bacterium]
MMSASRTTLATLFAFAVTLPALGCMDDMTEDKGAESALPDEGKLDSFAKPTEHGVIPFETPSEATLAATAKYHAWTFELSGTASIHAFTGPSLTARKTIDTVLYLYKQKADGSWGAYIARNDDYATGSKWSGLTRSLDAGNYRVLAKGYTATTYGQFSTSVECTGAGCAAVPSSCLFGTTFGELLESSAYRITNDAQLHVTDYQSDQDKARIVLAVQQSAHTDVMTVEQAFAAVDQQVIRRVDLYDEAGGRSFTAFEYGAGDNSYGAVFAYGSTTIVSKIHDGDLEACTAVAQVCSLGPDFYTTKVGGAFTVTGQKVVTKASQLSGNDASDALAAIRVAYPATSLANGLSKIDGGQLNVVDLTENATGATLRAFEYGAGDNSYGAIFVAGTKTRASSIVDATYYDCAFTN